jgi:hypothetical protein
MHASKYSNWSFDYNKGRRDTTTEARRHGEKPEKNRPTEMVARFVHPTILNVRIAGFDWLARMKTVLANLVVLLTLGVVGCSKQGETVAPAIATKPEPRYQAGLSQEQRTHILDGDFSITKNTADLPERSKSAFAVVTREAKFDMADPGHKFQVTDVIVEKGLPWRRLIFAGSSKDRWFIYYEHGGYAHSYHLAIFSTSNQEFLWCGVGAPGIADLQQLRSELTKGEFKYDCGDYM